MAIVSKLAFAALAGLFVANFASPASAQADAARDAAIHKCVTEAQHATRTCQIPSNQRARTDVYIACMGAAGQRP